MSILDSVLSQVAANPTVDALAAKMGLSPQMVETAIAALVRAHQQPGDTVTQASQQTGLPKDKLSQIVGSLGGEGALGQIAGKLLQQQGGNALGSLSKFL